MPADSRYNCTDSPAVSSPTAGPSSLSCPPLLSDQKRAAGKQADSAHQFGYATNFGAVRGTASVRGVEGQMIGIIFGEYMRRLVAMSRELRQPEHLVSPEHRRAKAGSPGQTLNAEPKTLNVMSSCACGKSTTERASKSAQWTELMTHAAE